MRLVMMSAVAALLLAACVTAPPRSEQLEQARAEVTNLAQEPLAQQAAASDLAAARDSLQRAEAAQQHDTSPEVVDHYAYLAMRHAQAGEARVAEAAARQEVAQAQAERNRILLESRTRDARVAQAQAQDAQAQAQNAQAQAEIAKNQALTAQQQLADTQQQLADLQAKKTDRGMVVTLGDVLFDTGQATLKPGADLVLSRLATFMAAHPQTKILIEGHTDSRGSDDYNVGLSERRAQSVANALMGKGVPQDNLRTMGRGKAYPVATNDSPEGRQQNRRVEIIFSDASGQFAQGTDRP
ncbi:MAG TPA: OmpA family protein [Steroidobacteraceae bacterium]|nr:OmpA family protein [Steroidobacteraceae bacterium]